MTKPAHVIYTLADGSKLRVDEREIPAFEELIASLRESFPTLLDQSDIVRSLWESNFAHEMFRSFSAQENASKPRRAVTRQQLEDFRAEFTKKHAGRDRGWKKAACIEFGIKDLHTLRARLNRED